MKGKPGEYIYVYDSDNHQIVVIDSETGERVDREDDQVTSILQYLNEQNDATSLRKFSVWCAHQTNQNIKPIQKKFIELAEKAIQEEVSPGELEKLYRETEGTAVATDTVGLQHGAKNAPAFLASRECVNPDPLEGALQAARFHRLWSKMEDGDDDPDSPFLKEIKVKASETKVRETEQQQIDYLLELIGA